MPVLTTISAPRARFILMMLNDVLTDNLASASISNIPGCTNAELQQAIYAGRTALQYRERRENAVTRTRQLHPYHGRPWNQNDDDALRTLMTIDSNDGPRQLSQILARTRGAIKLRMKKLGITRKPQHVVQQPTS